MSQECVKWESEGDERRGVGDRWDREGGGYVAKGWEEERVHKNEG